MNSKLEIDQFLEAANQIIIGKKQQIKLSLCTVLSEGHLLIEDVPGVGKTTLVRLLAKALGLKSSRVQFTNDLLPADILGTSIFDARTSGFSFHQGPIFNQIVIADELNRATPKTQSACLEAMEERRVSIDGRSYDLPKPFVLVATQNPLEQAGTYPLPEAQLDRFLMRIEIGYPDRESEKQLLKGDSRESLLQGMKSIMTPEEVLNHQAKTKNIYIADSVIQYIQNLLEFSRSQAVDQKGLSPRAGLALVRAAKSYAYIEGRDHVLPDDVKAVAVAVMGHRLNHMTDQTASEGQRRALEILDSVSVDE